MEPEPGPRLITNLDPLHLLIERHKLHFIVGPRTRADGNCFLWSMRQNMEFYRASGSWDKEIKTVDQMRQEVICYMEDNRRYWTEKTYNPDTGTMSDPPLDVDSFRSLIEDQKRPNSDTDNRGMFVLGFCKYFNIELHILNTGKHFKH